MRCSRLYNAGEMKRQRCQRNTGTVRNSATTRQSFMGVMNGEVTPVAIMLLPSGSLSIMGLATQANTRFWNGNRQQNSTSNVATELSRRRRISSRLAMSVGLISDGSPGLSSGAAMFVTALAGFAGLRRLLHLVGVAAHLLDRQLTLDLLVEAAQGGAGLAHPQADAAGEPGQALRTEHHQRDEEDE